MNWFDIAYTVLSTLFFTYTVFLLSGYIFIGLFSIGELRKYRQKNSFTNYQLLANSDDAPEISILAPAYNEGANIIENVRSLLSIYYNKLEVIIINDGSKDDTLEKLINSYELYKVEFFVNPQIATKTVRGVYKSRNKIYSKLTVVDKENGGKADALNVGINIARNDFIVCIDVDCIIEQDAILKLVKPFLESARKRVIATGGVVRIANGCEVKDGRLIKVHLPRQVLPRMQTLEYIRAFLLGRMAWSRLGGLMLISGAFGAFDKEIVIKCGGYNPKTVGEDMELVVRMRRYMEEMKIPYKVSFIPDPLCWTEAPATFQILGRQRNRWTRGTIETLKFHKVMFFNPAYGLMGMLSYPYWFFFEFLAPLAEFGGFVYFHVFALLGMINYSYFLSLLLMVYTFGVLYSIFAILMEVLSYNQYKEPHDILSLFFTAFTEPLILHPFGVWSAVKGNIDLIRKKNSWGEMTRAGLSGVKKPIIIEEDQKTENRLLIKFFNACQAFAGQVILWLILILLLSVIENILNSISHDLESGFFEILVWSSILNVLYWFKLLFFIFIVFTAIYIFSAKFAIFFFQAFIVLLFIIQLGLVFYFNTSLGLLGADLYTYSIEDIRLTLGASGGVSILSVSIFIILISGIIATIHFLSHRIKINRIPAIFLPVLSLLFLLFGVSNLIGRPNFKSDFENSLILNKSDYFFSATYAHFFPRKFEIDIYDENHIEDNEAGNVSFEYVDELNYPFLHKEASQDVLSPFFQAKENPPNIVIILVEGLGRAYSNDGAYLGSFTPFLDSLSEHSLFWKNFLSQGGRTFAVLPSILGSLPFGKNGFLDLEKMPDQLSLLNLLKFNGYQTSFYYGGDADFDRMRRYLQVNRVDEIRDEKTFPTGYLRLPSINGFNWGYNDKELFRYYLSSRDTIQKSKPQFSVILTVSSHNSFIINEPDKYAKVFERQMNSLKFDESKKQHYKKYKDQYVSILYTDDALRIFFREYKKRVDFENTIFIITGDHRMPEIPMSTKIDRYHVPMIVYSPLLKRTAVFSSVSSHFDLPPTVLAYLKNNHKIKIPSLNSWIGEGLDTGRKFRNLHKIPLMQNKTDILDFVIGEYHLNGNDLFKLNPGMDEERINDDARKNQLLNEFNLFRKRNAVIVNGGKIIPDSLYKNYTLPK